MIYKFDQKTLSFVKTKSLFLWKCLTFLFISLSIISALLLLSFTFQVQYVETEMIVKEEKLSKKEIFEIIESLPFKYPEIIKAQALLETGHFKSKSFTEHNNLFGFKLPHRRMTTAKGIGLNHASYDSVEDCIIDRLIYEAKYMDNLNRKQYLDFLDRVYAEDGQYIQKLESIIKKL